MDVKEILRQLRKHLLEAVPPMMSGFTTEFGKQLGKLLAAKLGEPLAPSPQPAPPAGRQLSYSGTLYWGQDPMSAFWCYFHPLYGWSVLTAGGWESRGSVQPPRYQGVCHFFWDPATHTYAIQSVA